MRTFVVSDIHGCYDSLVEALKRVSFKKGKDRLIIAGDLFDRGQDSFKIYKFVRDTKNIIVLKGNHELILEQALDRKYLSVLDFYNGVSATLNSFAGSNVQGTVPDVPIFKELRTWLKNLPYVWSDEDFLVVHSFDLGIREYKNLHDERWEQMTWSNPLSIIQMEPELKDGVAGKTVLFGHWHASLFWDWYTNLPQDRVWTSESRKLVALDTCTNRSNYVGIVELLGNGEIKIWERKDKNERET